MGTKLAGSFEHTSRALTEEFIAGLVTSDGVFSAVLVRRGKKNQHYHRLDLKFSIQLRRTELNKNLLWGIHNKFGNKGNLILYEKQNNYIEYQITNQKDLLNVVIPFFMKYHIRGEKFLSFLRFKYIAETISTKSHLNKDIFLSLIVIAGQINSTDKLGSKIRYLNPEEARYVVNNIIPEGVDISYLTNSIANLKLNPLSLDFVKGLFETNTNNYRNVSKEDQDYIRYNFLPPSIELWRFKEYYLGLAEQGINHKTTGGLNDPSTKQKFLLGKRSYSTDSSVVATSGLPSGPVKSYKNADIDKLRIISENKGKAGVYRWINIENGKSYIGSSVNLGERLRSYFSINDLIKKLDKFSSIIYTSLLKYGYSGFSVEILEYCDRSEVRKREQYYFDLMKPEYNILKFAGSLLGHVHPEDSLTRNWTAKIKVDRLNQLKILNADEELNLKKRAQLTDWNKSEKAKEHRKKLSESRSVKVKMFDALKNETIVFGSMKEASETVGRDGSVIRLAIKKIKEEGISRLINERYYVILDDYQVVQPTKLEPRLKIEVTDTLTNKKTVYETKVEAAEAVGSDITDLWTALKEASSPDKISLLIKKRYTVKLLKD